MSASDACSPATSNCLLHPGDDSQQVKLASFIAAALHFLTYGIIFGTWASLVPAFKEKFSIGEAQLSMVMLCMAAGAIFSMPAAGKFVVRNGSRQTLRFLAPALCITFLMLIVAPSYLLLLVAATLFGASKGAFSVTSNAQAVVIENNIGKPRLSIFHALWSLGGFLAAFIVGTALKSGYGMYGIAFTTAGILLATTTVSSNWLLGGDASTSPPGKSARFRLPSGRLLRIGIVVFLALFAEGVMMDWSVVYAREVSHAADWIAPLAYGVFSGCMAAGRLAGVFLISRLGSSRILKLGGSITAVGLLITVLFHTWPATFLGLALAGFGLSNLAPILFGAGGRTHGDGAGSGVATVTTMGYFGFLIGPPLIGGISEKLGLPGAFMLVVLFAAVIAIFSKRLLGEITIPGRR